MDPDAIKRQITSIEGQIDQLRKEQERNTMRHEASINDALKRADNAQTFSEDDDLRAEQVAQDFAAKAELEQSQMEKDSGSFDAKINDLESQKTKLESDLRAAEAEAEKQQKLQMAAKAAERLADDR